MKRLVWLFLACLCLGAIETPAQDAKPLLLQQPTVNRTHIVFVYAGDLWIVPRAGGAARRLTSGVGVETKPLFSPDGNWVAFTGDYDGNLDVYVVAAQGGNPRRLTWHPAGDLVNSWSPDGTDRRAHV